MSLSALPVHRPVGTAQLGVRSVEPGLMLNTLLSVDDELGGKKLARTGLNTGGGHDGTLALPGEGQRAVSSG